MIRINLLPARRQRQGPFCQQWAIQAQIGLGIGILLLTIIVCWVFEGSLNQQIPSLRHALQSKEQILATLNDEAKQIRQLEQVRTVLLADSHLLVSPASQKMIPVILLDVVSQSLDPLDLWLNTLSIKELEVKLEGRALDGKDILRFIDNLEKATVFGKLTAVETRIEHVQGVTVHNFNLGFRMKT